VSRPAASLPAPSSGDAAPAGAAARRSGYIVGPVYDAVFFLYAPLLALVLGIGISRVPAFSAEPVWLAGRPILPSNLLIGTFIAAHLVLVFLRSHGNRAVFARHPLRFTAAPIALFCALLSSIWLSVFVSVLAIWWDVYHSSLQTFGIGRIYDARAGNDPRAGRRLDVALNLLLYVGPILGGATLVNHLRFFENFERVGDTFFTAIPAHVTSVHATLTWAALGLGTPFLGYYVYAYWRLAQRGYRVSPQKVFLLASTGLCSIYTWGFNSFGEAFFIMNFFHAWQYFALLWWSEGCSLQRRLRLDGRALGKPLTLSLFVGLPLAYGALVTAVPTDTNDALFCLAMVVSILHFWYDGFIWSVRAKQVA